MKKKQYETPMLEVVVFEREDIITTSNIIGGVDEGDVELALNFGSLFDLGVNK